MTPQDMRLRYYPDKVLLQNGEAVTHFDDALRVNVERMFEIMGANRGIGLAAHQVGWPVRLFVMAIPQKTEHEDDPIILTKYVVINPSIVETGDELLDFEEGCLSFPDIRAMIKRPDYALLRAQDLDGKEYEVEAEGLLSRCIQHEFDHITGKLFHRLWSPVAQTRLKTKLKQLIAEA